MTKNKNGSKMKVKYMIFRKKRRNDGERIIYIFGLRVLSYRKEKVKRAKEYIRKAIRYPIYVREECFRLKKEIQNLKSGK